MQRNSYSTLWICGIIIAVFFAQQFFSLNLSWPVGSVDIRFILSVFAHGSVAHLVGNLFALFLFGLILEEGIGTKRFLLVLGLAAVMGQLAGIGSYERVLGISGAVYGIFGSLAVIRPRMIVYLQFMPVPMILAAAAWTAVDLLGAFSGGSNTGHLAHLAGLVGGILLGFLFKKDAKPYHGQQWRSRRKPKNPQLDAALDAYERDYMR